METNDIVRQFLMERLASDLAPNDLTDSYPILERGLLDSTALLELVAHLEMVCDVEIDEEDLVPENFGSIAEISSLVSLKRQLT